MLKWNLLSNNYSNKNAFAHVLKPICSTAPLSKSVRKWRHFIILFKTYNNNELLVENSYVCRRQTQNLAFHIFCVILTFFGSRFRYLILVIKLETTITRKILVALMKETVFLNMSIVILIYRNQYLNLLPEKG